MPLPPPRNPPTASDEDCAICQEPLLVPSSNNRLAAHLIDDVEFRCKHHFHRNCILEYASSSYDARNRCALCRQSVLNSQGEFVVQMRSEDGFIGGFDFGHAIDEYLFYKANPDAERKMTFLSLMSQMEFSDAELFLKGEDPDANGKMDPNVCYVNLRMTAMHMAALNDDVEGIQLLLRYGADKNIKTEDGQTALDLAKSQNATKAIELLSEG